MNIQMVLDKAKAREIADYINSRNGKQPQNLTTLKNVCRRFGLNQTDAKRIIESVDFLTVSDFAYKPPRKGAGFGETLAAAFHPTIWEDAPDSKRLVVVLDDAP